MNKVLEGIRVLELGQVLAGPFAGAILADLGAEVVKLERAKFGDDARHMGAAFRNDAALNFHIFNRGKRSVVIDLKSPSGLAEFERLAQDTDILVHNLRPGVTEQLGIDGASMCTRHPQLIYCGISAFGHVGPMALQPGYEPLVQAFSGMSSTNGGPDDPPMRSATSLCDQGTGMWAVIAALALLERRHRTGRGGVVHASLLETALAWNAQKADAYRNEGRLPDRHRSGHPGFVPYESFETADQPILICCGNDRLFARLAHELGQAQWLEDERFSSNRARLRHKAELFSELEPLLRRQSRDHWLRHFERASVPCAPVHTIPEALAHPQVQALEIYQPIAGEDFGLTALPVSIDGERPRLAAMGPRLGEHNADYGLAPVEGVTHE